MFDDNVSFGKVRDLPPPPPPPPKNDDMDILDGPSMPKSKSDIVNEPMDPLDPPPCDNPAKKKPLWLHDTLQDDERRVTI